MELAIGKGKLKGSWDKDLFADNFNYNLEASDLTVDDLLLFILLNDIVFEGNKILESAEYY